MASRAILMLEKVPRIWILLRADEVRVSYISSECSARD
jgi:hypothetical protein